MAVARLHYLQRRNSQEKATPIKSPDPTLGTSRLSGSLCTGMYASLAHLAFGRWCSLWPVHPDRATPVPAPETESSACRCRKAGACQASPQHQSALFASLAVTLLQSCSIFRGQCEQSAMQTGFGSVPSSVATSLFHATLRPFFRAFPVPSAISAPYPSTIPSTPKL